MNMRQNNMQPNNMNQGYMEPDMPQGNMGQNMPQGPMKFCKHCQSPIPKKAKVCPYCGRKQKGKLKWIVIGIIIVCIVSAKAGNKDDGPKKVGTTSQSNTNQQATNQGSSNQQSTNQGNSNQANNNTESQTTESVEQTSFVVGDVIETDEFKISFLSAEEYTSDNQFMQPGDGNVFYRMEFEFENITDESQNTSSMIDWDGYADGYSVDQRFFSNDDLDATLSPGKKAKGAIYLEVPEDSAEITLEYKPNPFLDERVEFIIK